MRETGKLITSGKTPIREIISLSVTRLSSSIKPRAENVKVWNPN